MLTRASSLQAGLSWGSAPLQRTHVDRACPDPVSQRRSGFNSSCRDDDVDSPLYIHTHHGLLGSIPSPALHEDTDGHRRLPIPYTPRGDSGRSHRALLTTPKRGESGTALGCGRLLSVFTLVTITVAGRSSACDAGARRIQYPGRLRLGGRLPRRSPP